MKRKIALIVLAMVLAVSAMVLAGCGSGSKGGQGDAADPKAYTLQVVSQDGTVAEFKGETAQEYLQGAMEELAGTGDFSYEETGGMVITINGERADYNEDNAYWAIYVNDEYGQYGIAEQPVTDGDTYKFEYTPAA